MKSKSEDQLDSLKEDVDWRIVGTSSVALNNKMVDWGIQILQEGRYKDIILVYGEMNLSEAEDGTGDGTLTFDFDVFHRAGKDDIQNDEPELQQLAGDLLVTAFTKALDEGKAVINGRDSEQDYPTITLD